jgi:hypothetical protein
MTTWSSPPPFTPADAFWPAEGAITRKSCCGAPAAVRSCRGWKAGDKQLTPSPFRRTDAISAGAKTSDFSSINDRGPLEHRFDLRELERLADGLSGSDAVRAMERVGKNSLTIESGGPRNDDYRLHIKEGGKRRGTIERGEKDGFWHSAYTFTPDGQSVLSGGQNGELRLFTIDAKPLARLVGHTGEIKAVAVSADGRWALSGANDQTLNLWNLAEIGPSETAEIAPTLTLFPTTDGEWIAWTPEGYFAASARGAQQIGYSVNQGLSNTARYVSVDQLYDRFYRPDLVYTRLHGDPQKLWQQKEAATDAKTVIAGGLAPRVAFVKPTADAAVDQEMVDVQANVMDQGGGIGKVVWRINDTTVATDSYADSSVSRLAGTAQKPPSSAVMTLKQQFTLLPGGNTVELIAYNRRNEIASSPAVLTLTVKPPPEIAALPPPASPTTSTVPPAPTRPLPIPADGCRPPAEVCSPEPVRTPTRAPPMNHL